MDPLTAVIFGCLFGGIKLVQDAEAEEEILAGGDLPLSYKVRDAIAEARANSPDGNLSAHDFARIYNRLGAAPGVWALAANQFRKARTRAREAGADYLNNYWDEYERRAADPDYAERVERERAAAGAKAHEWRRRAADAFGDTFRRAGDKFSGAAGFNWFAAFRFRPTGETPGPGHSPGPASGPAKGLDPPPKDTPPPGPDADPGRTHNDEPEDGEPEDDYDDRFGPPWGEDYARPGGAHGPNSWWEPKGWWWEPKDRWTARPDQGPGFEDWFPGWNRDDGTVRDAEWADYHPGELTTGPKAIGTGPRKLGPADDPGPDPARPNGPAPTGPGPDTIPNTDRGGDPVSEEKSTDVEPAHKSTDVEPAKKPGMLASLFGGGDENDDKKPALVPATDPDISSRLNKAIANTPNQSIRTNSGEHKLRDVVARIFAMQQNLRLCKNDAKIVVEVLQALETGPTIMEGFNRIHGSILSAEWGSERFGLYLANADFVISGAYAQFPEAPRNGRAYN